MKGARIGVAAGAVALASAGYASAVGLARRQPGQVASEVAIEATLDRWLGELGVCGLHHYIATPVGRVHVLELGAGRDPLVFLHGLGASVGEYVGLLSELSRRFRVIGIDRPGSGLSDPVRFDGHPRPAWNQVLQAVAETLSPGGFDLVGHSLGGLAAGGFAVDHPELVRRLVLLSPVGLSPMLPWSWSLSMLPGLTDVLNLTARLVLARRSRGGAMAFGGPAGARWESAPTSPPTVTRSASVWRVDPIWRSSPD